MRRELNRPTLVSGHATEEHEMGQSRMACLCPVVRLRKTCVTLLVAVLYNSSQLCLSFAHVAV